MLRLHIKEAKCQKQSLILVRYDLSPPSDSHHALERAHFDYSCLHKMLQRAATLNCLLAPAVTAENPQSSSCPLVDAPVKT